MTINNRWEALPTSNFSPEAPHPYIGARATDHWNNAIADQEYVERIRDIRSPDYAHPGS